MGDDIMWYYMDSTGAEFGPYPSSTMKGWFQQGFFPMQGELKVRLADMPEDQHFYIKDLYPGPIMDRAFDGEPNLPPDPRARGGRSGRGGGAGRNAPPAQMSPQMPFGGSDLGGGYDGGLGLWGGMGGMPGMMPGQMPGVPSPGMPGMPPFGFPGMPGMGMPGMGMPRGGGGMPMAMTGGATGRYQGRIKSFNVQKGFGFIDCPEAHQVYGRDVFLHKAQIATFQIGSQVSFAVEINKTSMPQARDLLESDMSLGGFAGFGGMGMPGMGMGGGAGGGKGGYNNSKGGGKGKGRGGGKDNKKGGAGGDKKKEAGAKKSANGGGKPAAPVPAPAPAPAPEALGDAE